MNPKLAAQVVHDSSSSDCVQDTPFEASHNEADHKLITVVCNEVMKMFKGKSSQEVGSSNVNFAGISTPILALSSSANGLIRECEWIVDTRASDHDSTPFLL